MSNKKILLVLLFLFFTSSFVQANPFMASSAQEYGKNKPQKNKIVESVKYPSVVQGIIQKIMPVQKEIQSRLSFSMREFKKTNSKAVFFVLILTAFVFGMIHAAGPGHGKTVLFSYFLSNKTFFVKGAVISAAVAFMHAFSSIAVVGIISFIVKKSYLLSFENISNRIQMISYTIIILIGFFIFFKSLISIFKSGQKMSSIDNKEIKAIPLVLAVGLIPCPGALIILLFSLSLNVLPLGILMVLVMAAGMSVTVTFAGMSGVFLEYKITSINIKNNKAYAVLSLSLHMAGALFLILFAFFMLTPYL